MAMNLVLVSVMLFIPSSLMHEVQHTARDDSDVVDNNAEDSSSASASDTQGEDSNSPTMEQPVMATYHQAPPNMHFYAGRPAANVGVAVDNGKQAPGAPAPVPAAAAAAAAAAPVPVSAAAPAIPAAAVEAFKTDSSILDVQKQKEELAKQKTEMDKQRAELDKQRAQVASMESEMTRRSIAQDQKDKAMQRASNSFIGSMKSAYSSPGPSPAAKAEVLEVAEISFSGDTIPDNANTEEGKAAIGATIATALGVDASLIIVESVTLAVEGSASQNAAFIELSTMAGGIKIKIKMRQNNGNSLMASLATKVNSGALAVPNMGSATKMKALSVAPGAAPLPVQSGPKVRVSSLVSGILSSVMSSVLTRAMHHLTTEEMVNAQ